MKTYKINEIEYKRILGRNIKNVYSSEKPLSLFWAGSALEINVNSQEVFALISCDYDVNESYVTVFVNGFQTMRFIPSKKEPQWICLARNLNTQKNNLITIMKDTQPMPQDFSHSLFIHQIGLSDSGKFCPLIKRNLKIEFVGDSITTGEGLAGNPDEMDWISTWMSCSNNYAIQTAKKLNADFDLISQCGWGVCWGWDGNRNNNIPAYYEQICGVIGGEKQEQLGALDSYDFSQSKKDYVIINLGTNDNNAFTQTPWKDEKTGEVYDLKFLEDGTLKKSDSDYISLSVIKFLQKVRRNNPQSKIVWALGMMKIPTVNECIKNALEKYKVENKDSNVYFLQLNPMEDIEKLDNQKASRMHPGPDVHKNASEKIVDFIQNQILYSKIQKVFEKIKKGQKITVATLGGSITTGYCASPIETNSWASILEKWFRDVCKKYRCELIFKNLGVSGTDSVFGVVRTDDHVISNNVDLLILEYAMNDLWLEENTRRNSYEGIIRKVFNKSDCAVFALFVNQRKYPYLNNQIEQKRICEYYQIPYLSWKDEIFSSNLNSNFDIYFDGNEEIHPSNEGHKKIAELIISKFEKIWQLSENTDFSLKDDCGKKYFEPMTQNQFENCIYYHNKNIVPFENDNWEYESPVHSEWEKIGNAVKGWQTNKNGILSFKLKATSIGITFSESDGFKNSYAWVVFSDGTESEKVELKCFSSIRKNYLGWCYKQIYNSEEEKEVILKIQSFGDENKYTNVTGIIAGAKSPDQ